MRLGRRAVKARLRNTAPLAFIQMFGPGDKRSSIPPKRQIASASAPDAGKEADAHEANGDGRHAGAGTTDRYANPPQREVLLRSLDQPESGRQPTPSLGRCSS